MPGRPATFAYSRTAVLAGGVGRVGYIFYIFHLSFLSNVQSFGRRLNMTEILWFRLLNSNSSCQLLLRMSSLSMAGHPKFGTIQISV